VSPFTIVFSQALVATATVPDGDAAGSLPSVDVLESGPWLLVTVDLPGARPEGLRVTCLPDVLVVDGTTEQSGDVTMVPAAIQRFHVVERSTVSFRRVVRLPCRVDRERGHACFRDGVLTVSLPRAFR